MLRKLKDKEKRSWKEFILNLAEYYQKTKEGSENVPKESLLVPYVAQARALSEIGKLMIEKEDDYIIDNKYYVASLLPLLISGEEVPESELVDLYVMVTNLVLSYLRDKHETDETLRLVFEYVRIAIIRALKDDISTFSRFMNEVCKELGKLA
jgi:hypothetical protein